MRKSSKPGRGGNDRRDVEDGETTAHDVMADEGGATSTIIWKDGVPRAVFEDYVTLDYPAENGRIEGSDYTIRIGACETAEAVDVRINSGPWRPCRRTNGYWWYDWTGFGQGKYLAWARMRSEGGRERITPVRRFLVVGSPR